jgi:hypothetical protein
VPHGCSGIKGQKADRDHEQQWFAGLSMFLGRREQATGSWMIADPLVKSPAAPTLASGDSMHTYCQNVAGLWLKYGAKSLKIETSSQCEILLRDATIC